MTKELSQSFILGEEKIQDKWRVIFMKKLVEFIYNHNCMSFNILSDNIPKINMGMLENLDGSIPVKLIDLAQAVKNKNFSEIIGCKDNCLVESFINEIIKEIPEHKIGTVELKNESSCCCCCCFFYVGKTEEKDYKLLVDKNDPDKQKIEFLEFLESLKSNDEIGETYRAEELIYNLAQQFNT